MLDLTLWPDHARTHEVLIDSSELPGVHADRRYAEDRGLARHRAARSYEQVAHVQKRARVERPRRRDAVPAAFERCALLGMPRQHDAAGGRARADLFQHTFIRRVRERV